MASQLFTELNQIFGSLPEQTRSALSASEGLGSWDANLSAMVESLERRGVQSVADLAVDPRPILSQKTYQLGKDGGLYRYEDRGEVSELVPVNASERDALLQTPEYADALKQIEGDRLGEIGNVQFSAATPTGQFTGTLYNARTGEVIDDNKDNSPLEQGFYIDKTKAGKGKTHFNLYPVQTSQGFQFIPGTEYRATGLRNFMQQAAPLLGMAGFALGLPGVAASMGTAGTAAATALRGINALNAFDQGKPLAGIAGLAGMAPGVNQLAGLGLSADTLGTINTVGRAASLGQSLSSGDIIGALGAAARMPQVQSLLPGEIAGIPVDKIGQGIEGLNKAAQGDYLGAVISALDTAGAKTIPGTDISLDAARSVLGSMGVTGAKQSAPGGKDAGGDSPQAQANPLTSGFNMSGIAALGLAGAAGKKLAEQKQSEEEAKRQEAMRRASQGVSLFSDDPFARPQAYAGGGMVKKFSNGGFSDADLLFFDTSDRIFDRLPGVSGLSQDDLNFEQDWADATSGRFTIEDEPINNYFNYNTAEGRSTLSRIADSLGSAAKSLFTKSDGSTDWAKLATIAGGLYGYNKADDYDLSGVGYSGTVPQLAAARAQVPYEYDAERRPGSYGRRYLSDMYYAKPEDTVKIQQQALEQAKGIAALQRADGSMSTSIAPGGIRPLAPAPAPAPAADPIIPEQPQTPDRQWLYQGLGAGSSPDAIAAAYREWSDTVGGDTEANRNEALKYLTGIGISEQNINRAYDQYRGVPLDQYRSLTASSSPQDIARAYNQWIGTTGTVGNTEANRTEAAAYLRNLGLNDATINQAYDAYLNKQFAKGGIAMLARGGPAREPRYLDGNTNGQSDEIRTSIDGEEPALLSHGEFVVPADVVAALGGGNSNSGADVLYGMMDRVRKQAFGHEKQMKQVDPNKVLPA